LTECVTLTAPQRGQTMASLGARPRLTTSNTTSGARGTGATALPLDAALVMAGGGAPGDHGAPALPPAEEERGGVQGAALAEAAQGRLQRLSGVTPRTAVIVVPGAHGASVRVDVEEWDSRAGADCADRVAVIQRRLARAQPGPAPFRIAERGSG